MKISAIYAKTLPKKLEVLVYPIFEQKKIEGELKEIDSIFEKKVTQLLKQKVVTGKKDNIVCVHGLGKIGIQTLILVGVGKKQDCTLETEARTEIYII